QTPKRLLIVTYAAGFHHDSIPRAEAVLADLSRSHGIEPSFCRTADAVKQSLSADGLRAVDGVFFANTTGDLGIPDLTAFLAWIRAGHPFLAAHSATDTYHGDRGYLDMIGAEFATHGNQSQADLAVEDRGHPATAPLPSPFSIFDEIYEFRSNPRPSVHVLLSLDHHPDDGHPAAGQHGDFVLAWTKTYGAGKSLLYGARSSVRGLGRRAIPIARCGRADVGIRPVNRSRRVTTTLLAARR
ncbi:MAG TPA: ThuA domain-containing protein, partial [Vicinamibacterales bacterium]|nr:ThuA domain-containing protein [Vicinamibacterales bacterium]